MFQQVANPVGGSLALVRARRGVAAADPVRAARRAALEGVAGGLASLVVALAVAIFAFGMPAGQALLAASEGAAFGLFPIIWIVLTAIWIFRMTELTGLRPGAAARLRVACRPTSASRPSSSRSASVRCWRRSPASAPRSPSPRSCSSPSASAPIKAASVALVANTAPVAFGAIAVPITTLGKITGLDPNLLGAMVGRQTPILAVFVPLILVLMVDGLRGVRQTWLAALVGGVALRGRAVPQLELLLLPGRRHHRGAGRGAGAGAAAAGVAAVADRLRRGCPSRCTRSGRPVLPVRRRYRRFAVGTGGDESPDTGPVGKGEALMAFAPYLIVVALFTLTSFGPLQHFLEAHSGWKFAWPGLEVLNSAGQAVVRGHLQSQRLHRRRHRAAGGRHPDRRCCTGSRCAGRSASLVGVVVQFKWTILTVVAVLALAYVMNFSGQTVTLGLALAATGGFFAFLSPVVGWIGVAVTGSDTSANSLFGLLQTTAATKTGISPYLLAAANTSGGVLGQDDLAAEPGHRRRRGRHRGQGERAVPQGDLVEPGPAARHVRAGLPAVHPGPGLDGRRRVNSGADTAGQAVADSPSPDRRRSTVKRAPQVSTTLPESPAGAAGRAGRGLGAVRGRSAAGRPTGWRLGHDASHFALTPSVVATPADAAEVGRLFAVSAAHGVPMTFRSGGTSLSGQAVTDGILVDTRRHFRDIEILDGGARVRVGPGATVRQVNARLARLGRKLGPDPASEIACTLGGVVANNSSGMACGTVANTYNTLDSLVLVLPSGTVIDTGAADADERLRPLEPALYEGLARLRDRVRGEPGLGADRSSSSSR